MPELDYTENLTGREINTRMEELAAIRDEYQEWKDWTPDEGETEEDRPEEPEDLTEDEEAELKDLQGVDNSISFHCTLIHESNWLAYVRDFYQESRNVDWNSLPYSCIDWNQVMEEFDGGSEIDIQGNTFYEV